MRDTGFGPMSPAWKAGMITTTLISQSVTPMTSQSLDFGEDWR